MRAWVSGVLLGVCWSAPVLAQQAEPSGPPLGLREAIAEAIEKSPDIRAAEGAVTEARGLARTAGAFAVQPEFSLDTGVDGDGLTSLTFSFSQQVPLGKKRRLAGSAGEYLVDARAATALQARAQVGADAGRAFVAYWLAGELASLSAQQSAAAKTAREATERRKSAGDLAGLELLLAQAEEDRVRAEQARAEGEQEAARVRLAASLGRKLSAPIVLVAPTALPAPTEDADAPSVKAASRAVDAAGDQLDLARLGLLPDPTFSLSGGVNREVFNQGDFSGANVEASGIDRIENEEAFVSLQATVPLPAFRSGVEGQIDTARGQVRQAEGARDAVKRWNEAGQKAARASLDAAQKAEALLAAAVPRYEEALKLTEKGYSGGALSIDALILARTRVYTAKAELLRARAATLNARLDLAEARGEVL